MEAARETVSERVVTLMTRSEKSKLESKAKNAGVSVGEFVRRSVDAYDQEEIDQLEQFAEFARAFRESAERASAAVDRANTNVEETLEYFRKKRET